MNRHSIQNLNKSEISVVGGGGSTENRADYLKRTAPNFPIPSIEIPRFSRGGLPKYDYKIPPKRKVEPEASNTYQPCQKSD